ncbi:hypothetical protein AB0L75_00620 [Streptomyces sp. NPDC052101]|uniref:hypothetical protein n=1 Tax=Streptomyces sp. NPDC052101 TaxID=3155763 RepID=UPI00341AC467
MTESRGHEPYAGSEQVPGGASLTGAVDPADAPARLGRSRTCPTAASWPASRWPHEPVRPDVDV